MIRGTHLLSGLHRSMREPAGIALDMMDGEQLEPVVTSCLRSFTEQAKLYAQGRTAPGPVVTKAPPGESAHNWGLALDVTSRAGYNGPEQRRIAAIFAELGFRTIAWDLPHGEHPEWIRVLNRIRELGPGWLTAKR